MRDLAPSAVIVGEEVKTTEGEIAGWARDASEEDLDAARELEAQIDATRAALSTQQNLRLLQLAERFSLSPGEADALLILTDQTGLFTAISISRAKIGKP